MVGRYLTRWFFSMVILTMSFGLWAYADCPGGWVLGHCQQYYSEPQYPNHYSPSVIIDNRKKETVRVAVARPHGDVLTEGWFFVGPNEIHLFPVPAVAGDLYLRIEDSNGHEIIFDGYDNFSSFPVNETGKFKVKTGEAPLSGEGWTSKRFFEGPTESTVFDIDR